MKPEIMKSALASCVVFFLLLGTAARAADTRVIDSFDYKNEKQVAAAWQPIENSPLLAPVEGQKGGAARARWHWKNVGERAYYDRKVALNLSSYARVVLRLRTDRPEAIGHGTVYFHSGDGWYAGGFQVDDTGLQTITIDRSSFHTEGSPGGWDRVDRVRLSFWKNGAGASGHASVIVDELTVRRLPIAIVGRGGTYARRTAHLLDTLGLEVLRLSASGMTGEMLRTARLAILPHNPDMPKEQVQAVCDFMDAGGQVIVFYRLPAPVADRLGLERTRWIKEQYAGQFAFIRPDTDVLQAAPTSMRQDSWNVRVAQPASSEVKVVGTWVDSSGEDTGRPAVTLGPSGMFVGHVLTSGGSRSKRQFLAAAIAAVLPDMRGHIARSALQHALYREDVGDYGECRASLESRRGAIPQERYERADRLLRAARKKVQRTRKRLEKGRTGSLSEALTVSRGARQKIRRALFLSFPMWKPDFRGMWCHSAFGVEGWSWDRAARYARDHGFNALVVNMLRAGIAHYPSDVLPTSDRATRDGDQIAKCLKACRKYGLQLHIWKVNFNMGGADESFLQQVRDRGRLQADRQGNEVTWLAPSHPKNLELERRSMLEIVRNYEVDGIHFDYIRYPNHRANFSTDARRRFEEATGVTVQDWPDDVLSGTLSEEFHDWRCRQVTRLVRQVSNRAKDIRPGVEVSAAVFRDYPECRRRVGQDWVSWVKAGYLDFVCPMDYMSDNSRFESTVRKQLELVQGRIPVYPGLGTGATRGTTGIRTAQQLMILRHLDAPGFMVFNYDRSLADEVLPGLRRGVLAPNGAGG